MHNALNAATEAISPMAKPSTTNRTDNELSHLLPVVAGPKLRSGTKTVSGFMPAGLLIPERYLIPYHDPKTRKGYQRPPQDVRINELVSDLRKDRVDLPTAVLLNIRNRDAGQAVQDMDNDELSAASLDLNVLAELARRDTKFYVVDGQHRILALARLIEEFNENGQWSRFQIPFVCMLGASEDEEMEQFHVVNSKAKSVRTDLALLLLRQRAEKHPDVWEQATERGKEWQIKGQTLVERLADSSAVWRGRIRLPAMDKADTTIPSASMVTSLKPLLQSSYFGVLTNDAQVKVLDAYWEGIREIMRPAFDDPTQYVVQKGVGVIVMHAVLLHVLELVRENGKSVTDAQSFREVMASPLERLEGDDGQGNPVSGMDFWKSAPAGAAGSYSSSAGRRVLIAKLRLLLPGVEVL